MIHWHHPSYVAEKKIPSGPPRFQCPDCEEKFHMRRDLQSHQLKARHNKFSLICAWCDMAKTYRHPQDLIRHIKANHPTLEYPKKTFATNNCIFFTDNPTSFSKIYNTPAFNSREVIFARESIRSWCIRTNRAQEMTAWQMRWAVVSSAQTQKLTPTGFPTITYTIISINFNHFTQIPFTTGLLFS